MEVDHHYDISEKDCHDNRDTDTVVSESGNSIEKESEIFDQEYMNSHVYDSTNSELRDEDDYFYNDDPAEYPNQDFVEVENNDGDGEVR